MYDFLAVKPDDSDEFLDIVCDKKNCRKAVLFIMILGANLS